MAQIWSGANSYKDQKALKFTTASGVTAIVASSVSPILMKALKQKLERKLRKTGHLPLRER